MRKPQLTHEQIRNQLKQETKALQKLEAELNDGKKRTHDEWRLLTIRIEDGKAQIAHLHQKLHPYSPFSAEEIYIEE